MRPEDLDHLASSGCSTCREIAQRGLEEQIACMGRAVRGPVGQTPLPTDWVSPDNMIGDNIVVGENIVLGIHAQKQGNIWRYALTTWWHHEPKVIAVFEDDRLEEVDNG